MGFPYHAVLTSDRIIFINKSHLVVIVDHELLFRDVVAVSSFFGDRYQFGTVHGGDEIHLFRILEAKCQQLIVNKVASFPFLQLPPGELLGKTASVLSKGTASRSLVLLKILEERDTSVPIIGKNLCLEGGSSGGPPLVH